MTPSKLSGIIPDVVMNQIFISSETIGLTTNLRLAHFLSQCAHESGAFKFVRENLNYSADGLLKVFPKYFNPTTAVSYARQPQRIASKVYAGRMGNGNEASGDGWKFCGRGYIQLTGKDNYTKFSKFIGEDCVLNPDLVAMKYPLASAGFFFNSNGLWPICDKGAEDATVTLVTKKVNGGTIGLEDRLAYFKRYYGILGA
jgi:putative chitinase